MALATLAAPASHADQTTPDADPTQVIVTAQSRSQQIQSVPIAVQAMSGDALKDLGASNLSDIDTFVPGLTVDPSQQTRPIIYLRGVGTEDFGIGTDSPVGIYTDGVYAGKTGGAMLNFNDIKRVEVLKGPQGTLFGRNAAAGAISIVTNDPNGREEASGLVRLGNEGLHHEEVVFNAPINDSLAFRFSAVDQYTHGWAHNTFNGQNMGDDNDKGMRAALRWQGDATSAVLSAEYEKMNQSGPPVISLTGGKSSFGAPSTWIDPFTQPLSNDATPNSQSRTFEGLSLRIEHTLPFGTLNSTTAYRHFNTQNWQDADGSSNPALYLGTGNVEGNTSWQQEFKLSGQTAKLDWVAGVSAFHEKASETEDLNATTTSLDTVIDHAAGIAPYATLTALAQGVGKATGNAALQGLNLMGDSWLEGIIDNGKSDAVALYGDAIWHVSGDDNLTLGGRVTHDKKSFSWFSPPRTAAALDAQLAALKQAQFFPTLVGLKLLTAQQAALLQGVVASNVSFNNPVSSASPYAVSDSWNNFSPRVVFDHHLTPDDMVYASWSKGYQAGGFDAVNVNGHYDEERVTNLELGTKGQLRAAGLTYAVSAFHYEYTNLQSLTLVPASTSTGVPAYQVADSDQHASGVDLEGQWKISRIWRLMGTAEYLDQTYTKYTSPTGVNLSGQAAGAPFWSASAGVDARWPAWEGRAEFNLMYGYIGEKRCNADTSTQGTCLHAANLDAGAAQKHVDTRLSWDAPSQRWGVGLIVNNLTNVQYVDVSTLGGAVGSPYVYLSKPRSIALELRVKL